MASFSPETPAAGTETATLMLERSKKLILELQSLFVLLPSDCFWDMSRAVLDDVSQCVGMALAALNPREKTMECPDEAAHGGGPPSSDRSLKSAGASGKRKRPKLAKDVEERDYKRKDAYSWSIVTAAPYDDGYQWRKYGQKAIHGAIYPRNYFRCTYREEQHCPATKYVQQRDNDDSPMFLAIYTHKHTCQNGQDTTHVIVESSPAEKFSLTNFNPRCEALPRQQISLPQVGGREQEHLQEIWGNASQAGHDVSASEWKLPLVQFSITTPEIEEGTQALMSSLSPRSPDMELWEKWLSSL